MISPYDEGMLRTLQPMSPFFQSNLDRQQLTVPNIVVPLGWRKLPRQEGTWVELVVLIRALGEHRSHAIIGGVHLHHKLPARIRNCEDGGRGEPFFELPEGLFCL